jgi:hypothetical protein
MNYNILSFEDLLELCKQKYLEQGVESLTYGNISKDKNLYFSLYKFGVTQKSLIDKLELRNEYDLYRNLQKKSAG